MAKVKLNLTLDEDIKKQLESMAKEKRLSISAVITQYVLSQGERDTVMNEVKRQKGEYRVRDADLGGNGVRGPQTDQTARARE